MSSAPIILGLDAQTPGIGWGVVDARDGRPLLCGWRGITAEGWYEHAAYAALANTNLDRYGWHVAQVVCERVGGGRGIQSMLRVADCAGIVAGIATMIWPDAELWRPTPGEWKKGAGLKGNAPKEHIRAFVEAWAPDLAADQRQDALDAICMAYAGYRTSADAVGGDVT